MESTNEKSDMPNGLELCGEFQKNENSLTFIGGETINPLNHALESKMGMYILEEKMFNGSISADIIFEKNDDGDVDESEEAELIFAYANPSNFYCAGLTGQPSKYECKQLKNGSWKLITFWGNDVRLNEYSYHVEVEVLSCWMRLKVNNVTVFYAQLEPFIERRSIGFRTTSKSSITIANYKIKQSKLSAFVITQFGGMYDDLYNEVIKLICEKKDIIPIRVDEISVSSLILNDICREIKKSDFVIADISENNPNVFYELGYAYAIKKHIILLCEKSKREVLPFDIHGYRTLYYGNSLAGKPLLERGLEKYIDEILKKIMQ